MSMCCEIQSMMAGTEEYTAGFWIPSQGSPRLFTPIRTTPDVFVKQTRGPAVQ